MQKLKITIIFLPIILIIGLAGCDLIFHNVEAPVFSPGEGTYTTAQSVTISCGTSGAAIRYTTDGSTPDSTNGTLYSTPVNIPSTTTLKAIAYKSGMQNSAVSAAVYTIQNPVQQTYSADGVEFTMSYVPGGHTFPTGTGDTGTATVNDAYWIGETEVTYELWSTVYTWATVNGYTFANPGVQGKDGGTGITDQHPVTTINWRDAMVWCNALTEWYNANNGTDYKYVYYTDSSYTTPIRSVDDSTTINYPNPGGEDDPYVDTSANGFRLPSSNEWELAARWREDDSTNTVSGYSNPYFTQGNSASGVTADYNNSTATGAVAWYYDNSDNTHAVKGRTGNSLGLYDMSGNVWEWCFDWYAGSEGSLRVGRGGSWDFNAFNLQVGNESYGSPYSDHDHIGFRFARTP